MPTLLDDDSLRAQTSNDREELESLWQPALRPPLLLHERYTEETSSVTTQTPVNAISLRRCKTILKEEVMMIGSSDSSSKHVAAALLKSTCCPSTVPWHLSHLYSFRLCK